MALVLSFWLGMRQLRESRQSSDDERFDRAVARLAGSTPTERLSGVAGLGLYLEPQQPAWHRATLRFLVNALAVEQDQTVRGELLDRLSELTPRIVARDDLNDALERLRDRNRSLYHVGELSQDELARLHATAIAITALVRNGARTRDLSKIDCVGCDFTGKLWEMMNPNFPKRRPTSPMRAQQTLLTFPGPILTTRF